MKFVVLIILTLAVRINAFAENLMLLDESRNRKIPIVVSFPIDKNKCLITKKCPVAFLSAGYKVRPEEYSFVVKPLNKAGFLVLSIEHELEQDPPLATEGNLQIARIENWMRGSETLNFIHANLSNIFSAYDFNNITLIGHSNGGDISAWLSQKNPGYIKTLITLDNRRAIIPRNKNINVLSIRGSDFEADKGVIPSKSEQSELNMCIIKILKSHHDDMTDEGPYWLKKEIAFLIAEFLGGKCHNN